MINDSYGHYVGDMLLQQIASELLDMNLTDFHEVFVARIGGDEFLLIIKGIESIEQGKFAAKQVLRHLSREYTIEGNLINVRVSIGVAIYPMHGETSEELLKNADMAMYKAKELGRNRFAMYDESLTEKLHMKLNLTNRLIQASKNNEFVLFYQPIYGLQGGTLKGYEALLRWNCPAEGLLAPGLFIDAAEEIGLIIELGPWMLGKCIEFTKKINSGLREGCKCTVSMNVSPRQLLSEDFTSMFAMALQHTQIEPGWIGVEVTESVLVEDFDAAISKLFELKDMGVKISLDDFGTGYSSLNYLLKLPIDVVKIDRSFIEDITRDEKSRIVTDKVINLAKGIGFEVIAEGVETQEQLVLLREFSCDAIQGFLMGKPAPDDEWIS